MKTSRWLLGLVIVAAILGFGLVRAYAAQRDDAQLGELVHISRSTIGRAGPGTATPRHTSSTRSPSSTVHSSSTTPATPRTTQATETRRTDPDAGAPKVTHQPSAAGDDDDD